MKIHSRLLAVGLVIVCISTIAHAEVNLPKLSGTAVRSVVSREENPPDAFRYDYRVDNSVGTLPVVFMAIDVGTDPSRVVASIEGLDDTAGSQKPSSAMFRASLGPEGLLGIALPVTPQWWVVSIGPDATASWGVHDPARRVQPETFKEGFVMLSRALPGIRSVTLEGELWNALLQHDDEDPEVLKEAIDDAALSVLTVGPVALPEGSTPGSLAVGIDSLREQARTHDWIATDAASASLAALLSTLSAAINDGRFSDAKGAARDFLQLVESSSCTILDCSGKPLTSEAYALMRFNMEYLLAQLPN